MDPRRAAEPVLTVGTVRAWRERPKVERLLDELDARMVRRADA